MNKKLIMGLATLIIISADCSRTEPAGTDAMRSPGDERFETFEAEIEALRQGLKIPGLAAAIVQDQELVWAKGFGYADVDNGVEVTPDTPFHLASVTKPIAATLIMQLVEEGAFDLDDPVSDSPIFWLIILTAALAGFLLVYPFNYWLARRGSSAWPSRPDEGVTEPELVAVSG